MLAEQTENNPYFGKPTHSVGLQVTKVPLEQVDVLTVESHLLPAILRQFVNDGVVVWPQHPLNVSASVPFQKYPVGELLEVWYSASRSMFLHQAHLSTTIKLPTSRPHPLMRESRNKDDLRTDIVAGINRSKLVRSMDKILPPSKHLIVLTEIVAFVDRATRNGFMIRDLTPLRDGHYYLPAFSIPYVGRRIAERFGIDFAEFWGKHYAKAVGIAKAELMLRYGLQMETPNAQNWLIQLDKNFMPTGVIAVRDLSDANYNFDIARLIGAEDYLAEDLARHAKIDIRFDLRSENSFYNMDTGNVPDGVIKKWIQLHEQAYVEYLTAALGIAEQVRAPFISNLNFYMSQSNHQDELFRAYAAKR